MRYWHVDFDAVHPHEFTGYTVIESVDEPTEDEADKAIATLGTIYVNEITEITKEEMNTHAPMRLIHLG